MPRKLFTSKEIFCTFWEFLCSFSLFEKLRRKRLIINKNISACQKEIGINFPANVYFFSRHFPKLLTIIILNLMMNYGE